MAVVNYSYAQIEPGLSGYFDSLTNADRKSFHDIAVMYLRITGTDATLKCAAFGPDPYFVTVDGTTTKPAISGGQITLFSGLSDIEHIVTMVVDGAYVPTYNWLPIPESQILTVTGAAPAMSTVPVDFTAWPTFGGFSSQFFLPYPGGGMRPTYPMADSSQYNMGQVVFRAQCDTIQVLTARQNIKYSVDGGAIVDVASPDANVRMRVFTMASGLDGNAAHEYTIWWDDNRDASQIQGIVCLRAGAVVSATAPTNTETIAQFGNSITFGYNGAGSSVGGVDIFRVGLDVGHPVAKWGVGGMTTSQLTTAIPGYFTRSNIPEYALLSIGRNDTITNFQTDYTACIQALLTAGCTKIICRGLLPEGANTWPDHEAAIRAAIASFANPDIQYLDTTTWSGIATLDGVHPSNVGYETVAAYEAPALQALIGVTYTLTIDANGATSGAPPAATPYAAGAITLPGNTGGLAKTGFTLSGWNTQANGGGTHYALGGAYTMPEADTTLYAEWTPLAPGNTTKPTISGPAALGQQITGSNGSWSNTPTAYAYQWQRNNGGWADISAATAINYTPVLADVGYTLRLEVTATNAGGSGVAESEPSSTVIFGGGGETIVDATAYTAYGDSTAYAGETMTIVLVANGNLDAPITANISSSNGSSVLSQSSVTLSGQNPVASFTHTLAAAGSAVLTFTNTGTISNPSPKTLTYNALPGGENPLWDDVIEGSLTARQVMRVLLAVGAGKTTLTDAGSGAVDVEFMAQDGTTPRISATANNGARSMVVIDGGA